MPLGPIPSDRITRNEPVPFVWNNVQPSHLAARTRYSSHRVLEADDFFGGEPFSRAECEVVVPEVFHHLLVYSHVRRRYGQLLQGDVNLLERHAGAHALPYF